MTNTVTRLRAALEVGDEDPDFFRVASSVDDLVALVSDPPTRGRLASERHNSRWRQGDLAIRSRWAGRP